MEDVVVFTALAWERRAVSRALRASPVAVRPGTWAIRVGTQGSGLLVESGMGAERARAAALAAPAARAWAVMGCAGGLVGWLGRGQGVAAREIVVLDAGGRVTNRLPAASAPLAMAAARRGVRLVVGAIAASPCLLGTAREKAAAAESSGALVVDMESGAIATVAQERGIPFHGLRVVIDLAHESLPLGADAVDERTGRMRIGRAVAALAPPSRRPAAVRLLRGQRLAARALHMVADVLAEDGMPEPAVTWRAATA